MLAQWHRCGATAVRRNRRASPLGTRLTPAECVGQVTGVSAFDRDDLTVLGQVEASDRSNEIPAAQALIERLTVRHAGDFAIYPGSRTGYRSEDRLPICVDQARELRELASLLS